MARKINDGCVACGACEGACPTGSIEEALYLREYERISD